LNLPTTNNSRATSPAAPLLDSPCPASMPTMSTADPPLSDPRLTSSRRFRVQDSAPALWLMTIVLLVAGYGALRLLTGAADAPQVESPAAEVPTADSSNLAGERDEVLHKLRPQTSDELQGLGVLSPTDPMLSTGESWQSPPDVTWDHVLPGGPEDPQIEVARQRDLLR